MFDGERRVCRWRGRLVDGRGEDGRRVGGDAGKWAGIKTGRGARNEACRRKGGNAGQWTGRDRSAGGGGGRPMGGRGDRSAGGGAGREVAGERQAGR